MTQSPSSANTLTPTLIEMNRTGVRVGRSMEDPSEELIRNTLPLFRASLEDAAKYGGEVTRAALGTFDLRGDRKYVLVDTKVHMLMPGFMPGIPGWHTDGVPREAHGNPEGKQPPDIFAQEHYEAVAPRYHLLVTGDLCPTRFLLDHGIQVEVPPLPSHDLYRVISECVDEIVGNGMADTFETRPSVAYEWDWWALHTVQAARKRGWRFLIRVTESDFLPPNTNLRDVIRTQSNVYVTTTQMGW